MQKLGYSQNTHMNKFGYVQKDKRIYNELGFDVWYKYTAKFDVLSNLQ